MGERTAIEWTDHTFNPWWGCTRVSPACDHCYAETWAKRTGHQIWGDDAPRRLLSDAHWREPLRWDRAADVAGRPALVFCASMADVFEDRRDLDEHRARLFDLIGATPNLIWQLLTKRPQHVLDMVPDLWKRSTETTIDGQAVHHPSRWPSNVWIGTTVENQRQADLRIPHLIACPAPVRFLSCEPLLGPLNLDRWLRLDTYEQTASTSRTVALGSTGPLINWVIAGGESGPGARPSHPDWVRDLAAIQFDHGVPFFFKQWGDWVPYELDPQPPFWASQHGDLIDGHHLPANLSDPGVHDGWMADDDYDHPPVVHRRVGKKTAGANLDGREWREFPQAALR